MAREASIPIATTSGTNTTANRRISFRLRIITSTLIALLIGAAPAAQSAGSADAQYESLAKAYYDESFRLSPIEATAVGVHDYDDQIGDFSARRRRHAAEERSHLPRKARHDRPREPLAQRRARRDAARDTRCATIFCSTTRSRSGGTIPTIYAQSASAAVFTVMSKDYAPLEKRLGFAVARERLIPAMLKEGEKNITTVDPITLQHRRRRRGGLRRFLQDLGAAGVCGRCTTRACSPS